MAKSTTLDSYTKILEEFKNKIYKPIYLLSGEEHYYIDKLSDYLADNVLSATEKDFNLTIVYGRDVTIADVINTAR